MTKESFLLVSLEEDKSKKLAQVLSNETSRKILNYLTENESVTETEISKKLKIPLSTIHYNIKQLVESSLLEDNNYTYSKKGKEIIHYSLVNKYVIIAPKKMTGLKEKIKKFLPVLFFSGIIGYLLDFFNKTNILSESMVASKADAAMGVRTFAETAIQNQSSEFGLWFVIGSAVTLLLYFVWAEVILKRK